MIKLRKMIEKGVKREILTKFHSEYLKEKTGDLAIDDPPKRRFNRPHLHGATPQKTAFFIPGHLFI
jgi:hypothetical protein